MSDLINEIYLTDAVEFIVDNRGRTAPINECGIPLIATNCVSNEHLYPLKEKLRYVSQETYENWFRSHPNPGDILLTNKGSQNGAVCLVPDPVDFCIAQDMVALRADPNKIYPLYLFAVLRSSLVQNRIKELNVDSVIPHFKKTDFNKLYFPLPDVEEQKFIGDLYFKLSYKVELNRQINQTLEAMAQTIFKNWFVDFEPVKAKIAAIEAGEDTKGVTCAAMRAISGKTDDELNQLQSRQPKHYAQLKTTAKLFPAAMQDSELGEVPEGWTWKRADEMCDISIGRTPPRKESQWFSSFPDGLKWVSIRDMGGYGVFGLDTSETLTHDAVKKFNIKKVPDKTLILSFKLTVGRIAITSGEMLTNEAIAHFIQKPEINIPTSFYYLYLKQFDYNMLGSTSSIATAVNSKTIKALPIITPIEDVIGRFGVLIDPLFSQIKLVEEQNRELSQLRDTLLPKLLSGELSVNATGRVEEN